MAQARIVSQLSIVCLINQFGDCAYFAFNTNSRANPIQIPIFRAVDHQIRSAPNDEGYYENDVITFIILPTKECAIEKSISM